MKIGVMVIMGLFSFMQKLSHSVQCRYVHLSVHRLSVF